MSTPHTPGPWEVEGDGTLLHRVTKSELTTVRIRTTLGTFEVLDETNEPIGNINLIAAAPELLEALESLLFRCVSLDRSATQEGILNCEAMAHARAAIIKAKGEL